MFTMRHLVERRQEGQENMALGFKYVEKAPDSVPKKMTMTTLRWMGVPEADFRILKSTKGIILCGLGISVECRANVDLRQRGAQAHSCS